jgi:ribonuclease HII
MPDYDIEIELLKNNFKYICGVDEVGRGSVFGPVVSGAVILNPERLNFGINDSKVLSDKRRRILAEFIYENSISYSIGWSWAEEIDSINILNATKSSMRMAVENLQIYPDYVLIDAMESDFLGIEGKGIIKGDKKSLSIAAASIIAKVFRDDLLTDFAHYFSDFGLDRNKGYLTLKHFKAISDLKKTIFHRKSFKVKKWRTRD